MSIRIPRRLLPHQVKARQFKGENSRGKVYHPQVFIRHAYVEDKRQLVKDKNGADVSSNATVHLDPKPVFHPDDMVTIWPGTLREREARVITTTYLEHPAAPTHQVLYLE